MKFRFRYIILLFVLLLFTSLNISYAETFNSFDSYVKILKNGDAIIHNRFDFTPTKGTELYLPIKNLLKSELVDLKAGHIEGDKFIEYDFNNSWNVKATLEQKKNKFGLVKTDKGYEFCIGFGDYSRKTYYMQYRVTNFVKKLEDSDMVYWRFFNDKFSPTPKNATVRIFCDEKLNENNSKIWGFGYPGTILFKDGKIVLKSNPEFNSDNYITGLIKFNKDTFTGGEKIDKEFEYYYKMANEGVEEETLLDKIIKYIFGFFIFIILFLIVWAIALGDLTDKYKNSYKKGELKGEYYRKAPINKWYNSYNMLKSTELGDEYSIINAIFLKYTLDKRLLPIYIDTNKIINSRNVSFKIIDTGKEFEDNKLEEFFKLLKEAAGGNEILEINEFKKYFEDESNMERYISLISKFKDDSKQMLLDEGLVEKRKIFNAKGKEKSGNYVKYYNYLKDFTLLNEREITEVSLWKEMLLFATMFEISEKVIKDLKKVAPGVVREIEENFGDVSTVTIYAHTATQSMRLNYYSNIATSTGAGGGSSIGGGSGSFGGGSGGGSR